VRNLITHKQTNKQRFRDLARITIHPKHTLGFVINCTKIKNYPPKTREVSAIVIRKGIKKTHTQFEKQEALNSSIE
jgi:hypothetical protein